MEKVCYSCTLLSTTYGLCISKSLSINTSSSCKYNHVLALYICKCKRITITFNLSKFLWFTWQICFTKMNTWGCTLVICIFQMNGQENHLLSVTLKELCLFLKLKKLTMHSPLSTQLTNRLWFRMQRSLKKINIDIAGGNNDTKFQMNLSNFLISWIFLFYALFIS